MNFQEQAQRWLEGGDLEAVRVVLAGFREPGALARAYARFFAKRREEGARLVAAGLVGLADDRVLARLPHILRERPDVVRFLLEAWLGNAQGDLEALARGAWPFAEDPPPRFEWWRAAARFLEAFGKFPRWEWLGQAARGWDEVMPEQPRRTASGASALGARLKRIVEELERARAALRACELREREARNELEARERRIRELEQALASRDAQCREYERKLDGRDARIARLEAQVLRLRARLRDFEARAASPRDASPDEAGDSSAVPGLADARQIPFEPQELEGVWVIPYGELADEARERLWLLIGMYEAALRGEEHPGLAKTNWQGLRGRPKGLLLLGTDRLLDDMARLPLRRWLEASLFAREAYLFGLRRWVRAHTRALLESE